MQRASGAAPGGVFLGRRRECAALDDLVTAVEGGRSASLVLRGEAGIGKSALLSYVGDEASGCRVARVVGVEAEAELAFGGLHQLCAPFRDHIDRLPEPQRVALETAFGLSAGTPPDRFLVGLAVLNLLADVAERQPLVCLVDDAQWLDQISAQTLAFVARRLLAERVLLLFAMRPANGHPLLGLPHLEVEGLADHDARALLASVTPGRFDDRVRDRILAEARGNPLALLELPRSRTTAELARDPGPDGQPLSGPVERGFVRRFRSLAPNTQRLLHLAAAEPVGDLVLLRRAAQALGIDLPAAAAEAEAADLVAVRSMVRFRHPLVRSAAYRSASQEERQEAHRALAEATDSGLDPDRRAWHLANAVSGADERVASGLEQAAARARARGGVAGSAAFLARAAQLTPDPAVRGARSVAAARAKSQAGAYAEALELLDGAQLTPLGERDRAQADLVRGQVLFASRSASAGLPLLLSSAHRLETLDPRLATETYRDAMYAAFTAGRLPGGEGLEEVAAAVLRMASPERPSRSDLLLEGVARVYVDGYAAGIPLLSRALVAYRTEGVTTADLGWLPLAARMAHNVWDFESWTVLSAALVRLVRELGALSALPPALLLQLSNRMYAGDLAAARSLVEEAATVGEVTGSSFFARYGALVVVPWGGGETATRAAVQAIVDDPALSTEGKALTATEWAAAVLYNGLGRWEDALVAARRGAAYPQELGLSIWSTVELVEAAARLGRTEEAATGARAIVEMAAAAGTGWALGTAALVTALVSADADAEPHYREALARLRATGVDMELARTHLLYGEWLARVGRDADAGHSLRLAHDMLTRIGATGFVERTRRGLRDVGVPIDVAVPEATPRAAVALTPQESQIARLAADGLTNPQIGAQLYLSAHTVEWHLRKVFAKLGVRSRKDIGGVLAGRDQELDAPAS
ncbi:ATP-binding protein [Promicromonospora sp. NPDC057138]|uniref:ATP-binding protein n=1 Tax=Promicromonospora sp. NPDC057138 TaxID=3346031 RepID=UPI0036307FFA